MNATLPELVLVEDTLDDERLSLQAITNSGVPCHVTVQRDGAAALAHLLSPDAVSPSLVVLDYSLPKLNGLEILTRLRRNEKTRCVPVVIFSGTNEGEELTDCYREGANSCVSKPNDPKDYFECLARITRYWLTVNEAAAPAREVA